MANSIFPALIRDFVALIFPEYCLACKNSLVKGEKLICTRCILQMPQTNYHLDEDNPLKVRLLNRIPLRYAMAFLKFSKSGKVQSVLHALKYKNEPALGILLGNVYGDRMAAAGLSGEFELILPVPLHKSRKRKRGYNQSAKFAEGLAQKLGIPFSDDLLERTIKTETQTRKSKLSRWQNVTEVFRVKDENAVQNKNILLVDDVITTSATLEAFGNFLIQAGCRSLSIACIAEA